MAIMPKYIFADDFRDLEEYFLSCPHRDVSFETGDYLWKPGEPYGRIHYLKSGVVQNYLEHEMGYRKILSFHAGGTVFPGFHYRQYKIEESLLSRALTPVRAMEFTSPQFEAMFQESEALRRHVIDWYSAYVNLLIYDGAHQEFNSSLVKLCNLLYLLLLRERNQEGKSLYNLTQEALADILGVSLINVTRNLTKLRKAGIIATSRKQITVIDAERLMALCSGETLSLS
ncbi:Crp/Fnr family transcriptional regulator [uncultured Megasphaera sp.]|uniref:Crp/Fnr family transcriptional regulator n=1 Tax=uncultured Megasphaera sp. TaxID=165188 RepID=UPI0025DFBAC2|nr:Crp/Fnr family transcriptional regulator [uncultured Megasphaera sp.]